ncbi:MAG: universal stress protein [Chloroflexi bacterium]|nr:universal stress protein [Chloroflexota bacterium]
MAAPVIALLQRPADVPAVLPHASAFSTLVGCPLLAAIAPEEGGPAQPSPAVRAHVRAWVRAHHPKARVVALRGELLSAAMSLVADHGATCLAQSAPASTALVAQAPCPILVTHERCAPAAPGPIVVPIDSSLPADGVLSASICLAERARVPVVLLHALAPEREAPRGSRPEDWVDLLAVEHMLNDAQRQCAAHGITAEVVMRPGRAADVIVSEALRRRARAIVMSTHARTGLPRLLFGSVASAVAAAGATLTLLVRPGVVVCPELTLPAIADAAAPRAADPAGPRPTAQRESGAAADGDAPI